jgi:hypothetical protein
MHAAADTPTACENCGTALQGAYCHACGQGAHNPLHDVRHALEEVFESFWHLDGRVFRTLRDLLVPGRVACNYLRGQRVRYIPPLRLFLVLTVLTFFVGRLTIGGGEETAAGKGGTHINVAGKGNSSFDRATNEAEVQAELDRALAGIAEGRKQTRNMPFMGEAMSKAEREVRAQAAARIAELRKHPVASRSATTLSVSTTPAPPATVAATPGAPSKGQPAAALPSVTTSAKGADSGDDMEEIAKSMDKFVRSINGARLKDPKQPWDAKSNPVDVPWLPGFGDRWFNHRVANFGDNVTRLNKDGSLVFELLIAAVPSALFVMVPVFALLLRLLYLLSGRSYLEQLVIALYSHAFLLLTLLASFVLALLPLAAAITVPLTLLLWGWAGVYLLIMQHRVYGQIWPITIGKFVVMAFLYQFLIAGAALYIVFAGLTSGH